MDRLIAALKKPNEPWNDEFQGLSGGYAGKPLHSEKLWIPEDLRIEDDMLCWKSPSNGIWKKPERRMLDDFLKLSGRDDSNSVLRFAHEWGVLGFLKLKKDAPKYLNEICFADGSRFVISESPRPGGEIWVWIDREPWEIYPGMARYMASILNIAAALRLPYVKGSSRKKWEIERIGRQSDWEILGYNEHPNTVEDANFVLTDTINSCLESRFGLYIEPAEEWDQPKWNIGICYGTPYRHHGLYPALCLQLLLTASGSSGLYNCSGCGMVYVRLKKAPKTGNANYCDACGLVTAKKAARSRYRQKQIK